MRWIVATVVRTMGDSSRCEKCGGVVERYPDESFIAGRLRWSVSCRCRLCGPVAEIDGIGFPPANVRAAIAKESGIWRVQLDGPQSKPIVAKVLREVLRVSPKEAISMASSGNGVWTGTEVEVEWLVSRLRDVGVTASGVRDGAADTALGKVPSEE